MRFFRGCALLVFAAFAGSLHAESKNPADYPLRLHIFGRSQTTFYRHEQVDDTKGDGRADLFENGEARGVDFSYDCWNKVRASFGAETYPAKWKKPGRELVVLFPVFGKAGSYFTCDLKTDVKDFAYQGHKGRLEARPIADFKHWMIVHDYDPEHGKNVPTHTAPKDAGTGPGADDSQ